MTSTQLKGIIAGVIAVIMLVTLPMMFGINDAGHRTVVQYPSGQLFVKFDSGVYTQWFGRTTTYPDVITFDFDKSENEEGASIDQTGISVRYQDGGMGQVYGIARYKLPVDEESMIRVHKDFRTPEGVAYKIIKNTTEETINHTAGLMSSEESYAEKRGTFTQWSKLQLERGKFATEQKEVVTTEAGYEHCLETHMTPEQKKECQNVKKTTKQVPVPSVDKESGMPIHLASDLKQYGIELNGFNIVDWDYEQKTLAQIAAKREATMAIITAKAQAEKAKQDAVTAEQQGLADVMKAKYEKEVEKAKAVVDAEKEKEVAVVRAEQLVEVAEQQKLEQRELKLAAYEEKQKLIALGQGEAERKRLVMQADGALQAKLDAYVKVQERYAQAIEKQKWVPEIQFGGDVGNKSSGGAANDLIQMLSVQAAKDLSLDMRMKTTSK